MFSQIRPAAEIIVVDDGSTDGTEAMVKTEFPALKYFYQENNGVSSARNLGIRNAASEWLAFLDSDDEWLPEKLDRQQQTLQENPRYLICHAEEIWIRNGTRVNPMHKHRKAGGWIFDKCLPLCAMSPSSIIIHRRVFETLGAFDESLPACEDYDLWLRIAARFPVLFIEQALVIKYGGHEDQLSTRYWGMDRFRIQSLRKIVADPELSTENRSAAITMLKRKASIYIQGARKRGREQEAGIYQQLIDSL